MVKIDFANAQEPAINDTNLNQMQLNIENAINAQVSGDTLPVGCIVPFTSDTVPENWLVCDGSAISRTTYDLLFSIIGTTYGVGDGSTTFNLPNLKGKVAVGKDSTQTEFDTLGETGGEKTHTQTLTEMPTHNHGISGVAYALSGSGNQEFGSGGAQSLDIKSVLSITNTGDGQPMNNLQPYIVTNYIIKAQQSAGLVATVVDNLNSTSSTNALSAKQGKLLGSYSTTETVVGTWIDGKPLYRKVIDFGTLPDNTLKNVAHNISNLKQIVKLEGFAGSNQNSGGITLPHATNSPTALFADDTNVSVLTTNDRTSYTKTFVYVTYTKTTD